MHSATGLMIFTQLETRFNMTPYSAAAEVPRGSFEDTTWNLPGKSRVAERLPGDEIGRG